MPSGLAYPNYKIGFASPQRGGMAYPSLWRGCVGAWNMGLGATGARLFDHSVYGNHGTLTSMDPATDWVASDGKIALDFDGSDDSVVMSQDLPDLPQWTVSCWARLPSTSVGGAFAVLFAGKFGASSGNGIGIHCNAAHIYYLRNNAVPANRRIDITVGAWFHAVATYDGTNTAIYANGIAATAGAADSGFGITNTRLGHGFSTNRFAGQLDDVRVYSRVLTTSEMTTLRLRRGIAYETYRVPVVRGAAVTVTPTTATLTLATFAPTVSAPRSVTPTTATLTLSTFAPTVSTPRLATPTTATLTLTTFAPTVTATANVSVTPTTASLSLATFAPTVTAGGGVTVTPTTASLTLSTFAPTVSTPRLVTPTTATLSLTEFAPTVTVSDSGTVTPTPASLSLATFAPTVLATANITVTPMTLALTLTEYAPTISVGGTVTSLTIDFQGSGVAAGETAVAAKAGALASTDADGPLAVNSTSN